jgi:acyl-CoA reductase-like NAD-dependent aldehyde dehydrogenase
MPILSPPAPVAEQVAAARSAQRTWAELPVRRRLAPVRALRRLVVAEQGALCDALARDLGKSTAEALGGDLLPLADACLFLERQAERLLRPRRVPRGQRPLWLWGQADIVHRRPRGVVGVIGTWNYPLFLNGAQLAQALVAGNAVAWKPSEVAPSCAAALHTLFLRAGFPPDLVALLPATRQAGEELADADIDHVVFTGSTSTGRRLARRLGERLVSSTLELSGCDALFVLDDADVPLAARAAWFGALVNRGQTCVAARRAFVASAHYAAFCEELRRLAAGAAPRRLALPAQAEQAARLVAGAVADGGRLLTPPGGALASDECRPEVVLDARPEMALCREASFAPLLAVLPFGTLDAALEMDARCPYALGASVFTASSRRADQLAARLRAGVVTVNDVVAPTAHPATPFGGRGDSGWGRTQGAEGLLEMTVPQVVSARGGRFRPHYGLNDPDRADRQVELLRGLLGAGHAPTLGGRLRGWWRLLKALWRGV